MVATSAAAGSTVIDGTNDSFSITVDGVDLPPWGPWPAAQLVPVLRPLVTANNFIAAYPGNNAIFLGTEQNSHVNIIDTEQDSFYGAANWYVGDHVVKFGFEYETNDIVNFFGRNLNGTYEFANFAAFQAGTWIFTPPRDGLRVLDRSTGQDIRFVGEWRRPRAPALPICARNLPSGASIWTREFMESVTKRLPAGPAVTTFPPLQGRVESR